MRWRVLGPVLGLILLAAVAFSQWPSTTPPLSSGPDAPPLDLYAPAPAFPPGPPPAPTAPPPRPAPREPAASPPPARAPAPQAADEGRLDPEPDPAHLAALGLGPDDVEPEDGGALQPATPQGIRQAMKAALPEIKECYEGWLRQQPDLSGRLKLSFTIAEIPGRDRAKVMDVATPADAGVGHLAFEGCVRNVVKGLRFERPERGEMRVSYPLTFGPAKAPPP